ncbi:MAG: efflux RND transporter permease subunit [Syntrophales bacterium]|jgi:HAE1 family hydrophobic/amphiphilic exporter-1|nr:efflux RND transporter permease subunit [Syntrophales bacterium]
MWLADTSVKRPVFATMFIMALVVLGVVSYPEIGVDLFPKVDFPIVTISTHLNGASPEVIDVDITDKIEGAVNTINGVKSITSSSTEGGSRITVEFVLERDIDLAVQDVREKVALIRNKLPEDIEEPRIAKVDPDATAVMWLNLAGQKSVRDISTYVDEVLKEKLQRINGVGDIQLWGLRLRQVRVWLDAKRLKAYGLTAGDIASALQRQNIELPAGRIESLTKEYTVKIKGEFPNVAAFNDLVVAYDKGAPIRLRDVGRAEDGMEEQRSIVRFNGVPAVAMGIQKQSGTNTVAVVNAVRKEIDNIRATLPPGMTLNIAIDQSNFIRRSIDEVKKHLILGSLFAILAVFIFLRNVRTTLISAVALPISIISTFALLRAFDFTFNNMTMLALTLSVGLLIDDAIIVIENIYRHVEEGMAPREAATFATSEIGLAVMATTFAIVAIFLPVAFMKGMIGRFFIQFALTVVFSVLISLLVSFTLTPMLASIFLKRVDLHKGAAASSRPGITSRFSALFENGYKKVENGYRHVLRFSLNHRGLMLIGALVLFIGSIYMTRFLGKELTPPEDQGQFLVRLEAPIDYSVAKADELFQPAEQIVRGMPEVRAVYYVQGIGGTVYRAIMMVSLKPKSERAKTQMDLKKEIRQRLHEFPGLKASAEDFSMIGGGQRQVPIQYSIRGNDIEALRDYTRQISSTLAKKQGFVDIDTSLEMGKPELKVTIDRDKAADLGVDVATIAEAINLLVSGEAEVTKFKDDSRGKRYDLRIRLNPEDRSNPDDLGLLYVRSKSGNLVELRNLIWIHEGGGPSVINRVDRQRAITLFASLEDKPLGAAMTDLNEIAAGILPPDYIPKYSGQADTMTESFGFLMFAIMLGVGMAYMVLAAQFESFVHPFTVLLAMPLSFIGAFGALLLTGQTLSIFSFIGLILLMGLVKKNAILLVDYANILRERGYSKREAILHAGPVRLRPILMTTFAMVFGMIPVAFGVGEGAETRAPMGIAVIGGLLTSLFLTLVVVPAAYDLFDDFQNFFTRNRKVKSGLVKKDAI